MDEGQALIAPVDVRGTRWLVVAVGLALLAIVSRQPLLLVLAVVLALVAGLARLWWRHGLSALSYRRHFSTTRAAWGEEVVCELITENAKPLPLVWLDVVDEFPAALEVMGATLDPSHKPGVGYLSAFFSIGPYERVRRRYRLRCLSRGYYRFGPAMLTTGDLFGFAAREREFPVLDRLIVYPRVLPVSAFGMPARQPFGDARAVRQLVEDPFLVAGVRPYTPGESPRRIHWRASARTGTLQVKAYERSASPAVALFLDTNTFDFFWQGTDPTLLELVITATASLAAHALTEGQPVGLFVNAPMSGSSAAGSIRIAPSRHPAQLGRLLEALARLIPGSSTRIEELLRLELRRLPWGATVVILTGRVTAGLQRALADLARRGHHPVLVSCGAPPDLDPPLRRLITAYHLGEEEAWDALASITVAG